MSLVDQFINHMESLSPEERLKISEDEREKTKQEYDRFIIKLNQGLCYLCGSPIKRFHPEKPCIHWLLKPKSIKKKNIEYLLQSSNYGFTRINTYLRWVANTEKALFNINDVESSDPSKLVEETIKYKNLEWSFSCSESDFRGHENTHKGSVPHYHMQMKADNRIFFRYNDYHISLTRTDLLYFELKEKKPEKIGNSYAEGLKSFFDFVNQGDENQLNSLDGFTSCKDEAEADMHFQTIISAPEGGSISGDDIYKIIERAKNEGVSITSALHSAEELKDCAKKTLGEPGQSVPNIAAREGKRRKKKKDVL